MDKHLHNLDDIFNQAHQGMEEEPSAAVWDKLNYELDKKNAEDYRRGFIGWRRIAILLVLLLSGLILSEMDIIQSGIHKNDNSQTGNNSQKGNTLSPDTNNADSGYTDKSKDVVTGDNEPGGQETVNNPQSQLPVKSIEKESKNFIPQKSYNKNNNIFENNVAEKKQQLTKEQVADNSTIKIAKNTLTKNKKLTNNVGVEIQKGDIDINDESSSLSQVKLTPEMRLPVNRLTVSSLLINEKKPLTIKPPVFAINTAPSQNKPDGKKKFKPYWSLTAYAANDWAHYTLDNDVQDNNGQPDNDKDEIDSREKHEPSVSAGLMATWQFSKTFALKTGVSYSNTAIGIEPQKMYAVQSPDRGIAYKYITSSGYSYIKPGFGSPPAVGDSLIAANAQHNLQTVSLPVMLQYKIEKKKFAILPSAGIAANFITGANVRTEVEDAFNRENVTIDRLKGLKSFYFSFLADASMQYKLNNRLAFNIMPQVKYALSSITKGNVVKTYPNSFGLGFGITYKF